MSPRLRLRGIFEEPRVCRAQPSCGPRSFRRVPLRRSRLAPVRRLSPGAAFHRLRPRAVRRPLGCRARPVRSPMLRSLVPLVPFVPSVLRSLGSSPPRFFAPSLPRSLVPRSLVPSVSSSFLVRGGACGHRLPAPPSGWGVMLAGPQGVVSLVLTLEAGWWESRSAGRARGPAADRRPSSRGLEPGGSWGGGASAGGPASSGILVRTGAAGAAAGDRTRKLPRRGARRDGGAT